MKKLMYMLLVVFFLTGCDAEYNITINKATIIEELQIYEEDSNKWNDNNNLFSKDYQDVIESNLNYKLGVFFDQQLEDGLNDNPNYVFYKPQKIKTKNKLGIIYKYRFNNDNYERAYFPRSCFDNVKVYSDGSYLTISTSKGFNCMGKEFGLSNLTINIKTKYEVENSNSDSVDGYTRSWTINNSNYENKNIYIRVNTSKLAKIEKKGLDEQKLLEFILSFGITIAILLIIVIIILANKKRKLEN